jgi:hypothetical protein
MFGEAGGCLEAVGRILSRGSRDSHGYPIRKVLSFVRGSGSAGLWLVPRSTRVRWTWCARARAVDFRAQGSVGHYTGYETEHAPQAAGITTDAVGWITTSSAAALPR